MMKRTGIRHLCITFLMLVAFSFVIGTGCAKRPTAEEMKQLEEAKKAALSAESKVSSLKSERDRLKSEIEGTKKAIEGCENEKARLQEEINSLKK